MAIDIVDLLLLLLLIKRNGVRRNNTNENDNPSTKVITGKTAKALNELVRTTSIHVVTVAQDMTPWPTRAKQTEQAATKTISNE